jgi:DNA-binding transcriptional ArsR family regulator
MQTENLEALHTVTARFFKGLGDPVRLRILEFLEDGERSVGEIVNHLGLAQNTVSMQLGCLRWCGYVSTRREGRYVFYSLSDPRVMEIISLARGLLRRSEVYLMVCEVLGKKGEAEENLANVTGWLNKPRTAEVASAR